MESPTTHDDASANGSLSTPSKTSKTTPNGAPTPKLTPREQVLLKLEAKRRQEEENLTFKPKLESKRGRDTTTNGSRFEKLYEEARKRQEDKTDVKKDANAFKPKITARGRSKERAPTPEKRDEDRYKAAGAGRKREEVASISPKPQENFRPKISRRARSLERKDSSPGTRLYTQAQIKLQKQQQIKEQIDKLAAEHCTFAPQLATRPKTAATTETKKPRESISEINERMARFMALREKKLEDARKEREARELEGYTFKPTLRTKDRKSTSNTPPESVFDRLTKVVEKSHDDILAEINRENTFKPTLASKRAPRTDSSTTPVHERLYQEAEQRKKDLEIELENIRREAEKDNTFSPQVIRRPQADSDESSKVPVFERLSASRQYVHEILTQIKSEFELNECTFHPEINPLSEQLAKPTQPVHIRLSAEAEKLKELQDRRVEERIHEELEECTFSPVLSSAFKAKVRTADPDVPLFDRLAVPAHSVTDKEGHPVKREFLKSHSSHHEHHEH